ncbi:HEPN domain-containing protein [Sphingomonas sp. BE137]|uniref:HEPN domain-containing protein n=1 Tax=Sphingomonas sp. BE137 TaxID=2817844 RepID=UPI0028641390|nr:HEPN domain-containing protein [Sphingomonas sp. BE137]MDR6846971.1 putative nucleotidyltransferase/HEPN domain-containing protein [Sphingomonas sp. BE137]
MPSAWSLARITAVRSDVDHLPSVQQGELDRVKQLLMGEFAQATARANQPWKKNGRILKVILFGSYARDDWVDEPENGYQSDYDLLIIVSHPDLTDIADYWYVAEDKILRDTAIARPVNIIVHTLQDVNQALSRGEYFWVDIARDGIVLYELPGSALATPQPLTAADAYEMASTYFQDWLAKVDSGIKLAAFAHQEGELKDAAFLLHQATERAYICFLLVRTLYFPRSHNIKFLRSLAEDSEARLIEAWPRATRIDRRRFELLKRAYVEARYSASYEIGNDDLDALAQSIRALRDMIEAVSLERIETLRIDAGL